METETKKIKEHLNSKQNTLDKEGHIRPDWLFSYWIFAWFIIYLLSKRAIKESQAARYVYENMNPLYVYYIAITENILTLFYYIFSGANSSVIGKYTLMIMTMKALPIYFLRKEKTNLQINLMWFVIIFALYIAYLYIEDQNLYDIYKRTFYLVKEDKNKTPFAEVIEYIRSRLFPSKSA